jgi:hypothetical protein
MNVSQVKSELCKMSEFKGFEWGKVSDIDSLYGTLSVEPRHFKDSKKDEYKVGSTYTIFIAHMYKGQKDKEFFYILLYRGGFVRHFRKHQFNAVEYNKLFASGNSVKAVVAKLKASFELDYKFK